MKKSIYLILFIGIFVLLLSGGIFWKSTGVTTVSLNVTATNTDVVVTDSTNNVIALNGGTLTVGEQYTVTMTPNSTYTITTFSVNDQNKLTDITNNVYTFTCLQSVNIVVVSTDAIPVTITGYEKGTFYFNVIYWNTDTSSYRTIASGGIAPDHYSQSYYYIPRNSKVKVEAKYYSSTYTYNTKISINGTDYSIKNGSDSTSVIFNSYVRTDALTIIVKDKQSISVSGSNASYVLTSDTGSSGVFHTTTAGTDVVCASDQITFTLTANTGYAITSIKINNVDYINGAYYRVTSDVSIVYVTTPLLTATISNIPDDVDFSIGYYVTTQQSETVTTSVFTQLSNNQFYEGQSLTFLLSYDQDDYSNVSVSINGVQVTNMIDTRASQTDNTLSYKYEFVASNTLTITFTSTTPVTLYSCSTYYGNCSGQIRTDDEDDILLCQFTQDGTVQEWNEYSYVDHPKVKISIGKSAFYHSTIYMYVNNVQYTLPTITDSPGYVDIENLDPGFTLTFEYPSGEYTLTRSWSNCTVSILDCDNQQPTSVVEGYSTYYFLKRGETYTVSATASTGYQIDSITVNGTSISNNGTFTATENTTLSVTTLSSS